MKGITKALKNKRIKEAKNKPKLRFTRKIKEKPKMEQAIESGISRTQMSPIPSKKQMTTKDKFGKASGLSKSYNQKAGERTKIKKEILKKLFPTFYKQLTDKSFSSKGLRRGNRKPSVKERAVKTIGSRGTRTPVKRRTYSSEGKRRGTR